MSLPSSPGTAFRFPIDLATIDELAEDIKKNGLLQPVELYEGAVIDGRRRLLACKKAGVQPEFREVNPPDPIAYAWSLNGPRRHLTVAQKAMVGGKMREIYDRKAREKKKEGGKTAGRGRPKDSEKVEAPAPQPISEPGEEDERQEEEAKPEPEPKRAPQTRDIVAKTVGVGGKSIDAATKVLKQGTPELVKAVEANKVPVSVAAKIAEKPKEEQAREVAKLDEPKPKPKPLVNHPDLPGLGLKRATDAINALKGIPKNDPQRDAAFKDTPAVCST